MAKDDYDVIVCKVLVYLYAILKGKIKKDPFFLFALTKDFPVTEEYFGYVIENMQEEGYIKGARIKKAWGGDYVIFNLEEVEITPKGIHHLQENSKLKKIANTLPMARAIWSLFE